MAKTAESDLLKSVLKSLGLSARAAAERLGIPQSRLENWTCGRSAVPSSCWAGLWQLRLADDAAIAVAAEKVAARAEDLADLVQRSMARSVRPPTKTASNHAGRCSCCGRAL